jgi:flagellar hook protein FlgE
MTIPLGLTSQAVGTGLNAKLKFGASGDQVFDVSLGGNLDQTQWIKEAQGVQNGAPGTGAPYTISTTIYDSLGNAHLAQITYTPDATGALGGNANIASNSPLGGGGNLVTTATGSTGGNTISITVNAAGTLATISDGSQSTTRPAGASFTFDGANITLGNFTAADAGKTAIVNNAGGTNGLPAQVADPNGNLVAPAARWKVSTSFADGTTFDTIGNAGAIVGGNVAAPTYLAASAGVTGYAYFDKNGQFINTATTIGAQGVPPGGSLTGAAVHGANQATTIANGNQLNIRSWGTGTSNASFPTAPGVAPATGPIGLDFHLSSSLAGTATASVLAQNGFATGILSNLTVGQDGTISGAFTNGQTTTLGRVAVAVFQNEGGLARVGGSDFSATANSGLAQVGTATVGRFGAIIAGSLESSNVSIAEEFTKMIAAQNAYQANSKSITVASENMQTITQLIR